MFPEHKYLIVQCLRRCGFAVAMTGDGVNDAPALKRADCGVAVQGSTDAARAAADIVLTQPGLKTVVDAIVIARCIFQCVGAAVRHPRSHVTSAQACNTAPCSQGCTKDLLFNELAIMSNMLLFCAACCERRRMKTFINYRIAATLQLLVFFFIAVLALHPNEFHQVRSHK